MTRLFDQGVTVRTSELLLPQIGEATARVHPATAKKLKLDGQAEVKLNGTTTKIKVVKDETVPASVALLPRSMGVPINGPAVITIKPTKQEGHQ